MSSDNNNPNYSETINTSEHDVAHHITEFGEVENIVHVEPANPHHDDILPAPHVSRRDSIARRERWARLKNRLITPRHIHQYWHGETLYRSSFNRSVSQEELFLDIVLVGAIAALGHELRESFNGWSDIEKFFLLFGAIYNSWRNIIFQWNLWGVHGDLVDKATVYLCFLSLVSIALGAHGAFSPGPRPYVAIASFAASAIPTMLNTWWSFREPLLHNGTDIISQCALGAIINLIVATPYFAAAFVTNEVAVRILYWIPLVANPFAVFLQVYAYRFINRKRGLGTRLAVSIELIVEKYETLTMIVLGESVLGVLFEGALYVTRPDVHLGRLFGAAAMSTAILYSLETLYVHVDSPIAKGGKHALRHRALNGIVWGHLHTIYHMALILMATGIGISIRDIAVTPNESAAEAIKMVVRAAAEGASKEKKGPQFGTDQKWLLSVGWGASILLSGLIGATHSSGPRAATKIYRFVARSVVVIPLMIGIPFSNLSAEHNLAVFTAVLVFIAIVEYLCVHMDRLGIFRSETSIQSGSTTDGKLYRSEEFDDIDDSSEDIEAGDNNQNGSSSVEELSSSDPVQVVLKARLCKSHACTLVAVKNRKKKQSNS